MKSKDSLEFFGSNEEPDKSLEAVDPDPDPGLGAQTEMNDRLAEL